VSTSIRRLFITSSIDNHLQNYRVFDFFPPLTLNLIGRQTLNLQQRSVEIWKTTKSCRTLQLEIRRPIDRMSG
jgi:hypothetical protein